MLLMTWLRSQMKVTTVHFVSFSWRSRTSSRTSTPSWWHSWQLLNVESNRDMTKQEIQHLWSMNGQFQQMWKWEFGPPCFLPTSLGNWLCFAAMVGIVDLLVLSFNKNCKTNRSWVKPRCDLWSLVDFAEPPLQLLICRSLRELSLFFFPPPCSSPWMV